MPTIGIKRGQRSSRYSNQKGVSRWMFVLWASERVVVRTALASVDG
jgi:hypothetical protein